MKRDFVSLFSTLACVVALFTPAFLTAGEKDGRLDIYFIDVEGGAATLIVTPKGESTLIDSGYPDFGGRDRDRILKAARDLAGLKHLDHAVVSHWHLDHYGNHAALASEIQIKNFWDRGIPESLVEDPKFADRIVNYRAASQNNSQAVVPGDKLPLKSGKTPLSATVVTASRQVISNNGEPNPFAKEHEPQPEDTSDNAASLSLLFQFGDFKYLCCGDLTWNVEAQLVTPNNPLGQVDVFMVTHHGLDVSNNPVLVKAIDPRVTIMCNGPEKGGNPKTLATLKQVESLLASYQLHRNVKLKPEEQTPAEFIANSSDTANCQGVHILLSVAPDGKSYTVQIGTDGKPREFQTR
ncbi:MAG: ComEC/Rec2 family competence protein [Planctomycetaceae bacterium]